ncbi:MAG: maleylacetoacetate isomerase [Micavibrio sp.]|nr:maleylacetoacetate isomerase [Micavibrio sp.]|tara:strand:- start:355 stop:1041 length:687 start_codon:yes stop_codon:yes gene_type:complete
MLILHDYFRSSSSYRVRIALHHKRLDFEIRHVDLVQGQQRMDDYKALNPSAGVPTLIDGDFKLTQSPAILEYLEEEYPANPLMPADHQARAYVRQMAMIIATDIHPLNNLKVWKGYVGKILGADEQGLQAWYMHWIHEGFAAYESLLGASNLTGDFTLGDSPTLADVHLIPQLYNARRFKADLSAYPKICAIEKNCMRLESFQKASPESHPNAPNGIEIIHGPGAAFL